MSRVVNAGIRANGNVENKDKVLTKPLARSTTTAAGMVTRRPALRPVASNVIVARRPLGTKKEALNVVVKKEAIAVTKAAPLPAWKVGLVRPTTFNTTKPDLRITTRRNDFSLASVKREPDLPVAPSAPMVVVKPEPVLLPVNLESVKLEPVKIEPEEMELDASDVEDLTEAFSCQLLGIRDIDKDDEGNPHLVGLYINDIYDYLRDLEKTDGVKENFLVGGVTGKMRHLLIDWIVAVAAKFKLLQETLYLSVDILDRYLQGRDVARDRLQLVGITALFLASKYEEMYSPAIEDFSIITEKAYSTKEIRGMEITLLKELHFKLGRPLPLHFLRRNSKAGEVDAMTHTLAKYFMELTLMDYSMAHLKPSLIAGAALCLAMKLLERDLTWDKTLVYHSKYEEEELKPHMERIATLVVKADAKINHVVRNKYNSSTFFKISSHPQLKSSTLKGMATKCIS